MHTHFQNYIAGAWCDSSDGNTFENRNPANWNEIIGTFPLSTKEDVDRAAQAAQEAFHAGGSCPRRSVEILCAEPVKSCFAEKTRSPKL